MSTAADGSSIELEELPKWAEKGIRQMLDAGVRDLFVEAWEGAYFTTL